MIPINISYTEEVVSRDTNWGYNEFRVYYGEMLKFGKLGEDEEYKSEGYHSKQVYDWEILELFFRHHNLVPNFPKTDRNYDLTLEEQKIAEVNNMNLESIFTSISMCITKKGLF